MELVRLIGKIVALLSGADSAKWADIFERAINGTVQTAEKILEFVMSMALPAVAEFKAADFFKVDTSDEAVVKISCLGPNFKAKFLKKIEKGVLATVIRAYKLLISSFDPEIMTAIGRDCRVVSLAHLAELLKKQGHGKEGVLLINGWANVFYIEDVDGTLWAVFACWLGDGWIVGARSVEFPCGWDDGVRVFSR